MSVSNVEVCNWAYEGNLAAIQAAVKINEALLSKTDSSQRTGLHWACSAGKTEVVNFFITKGAKVS